MLITITIDTEEDDWGSYASEGASVANIGHLVELQGLFDRFGARPTYLVNRPPLLSSASVAVLGMLAEHEAVEIGTHCHPWNTPPITGQGAEYSMMSGLGRDVNRAKIGEVTALLERELGVRSAVFRAGRWGFGPTVAQALWDEGYRVDCSVSPLVDWSSLGGPDYGWVPHRPYRFAPDHPLVPDDSGPMLQLPTTVGFIRGDAVRAQTVRRFLEDTPFARLKVVGVLDRLGLLARRWLSPETSTAAEMIRVAETKAVAGDEYLSLTFHSCTLLPGATPFVGNESDRADFLDRIARLLAHCSQSRFRFCTLSEAVARIAPDLVGPDRSNDAKRA